VPVQRQSAAAARNRSAFVIVNVSRVWCDCGLPVGSERGAVRLAFHYSLAISYPLPTPGAVRAAELVHITN